MRRILASLILFATFAVPSAAFSAKPPVDLKLTGVVVGKDADGKVVETPVDKENPKPGDVIKYTFVAVNEGSLAVKRFELPDKIPVGTSYVPGSANGTSAKVEFSIDGGKTFSASPMVKIVAKDGTVTQKPANPATYTTIRWIAQSAIPPKGSAQYAFEVKVK